MTDETQATNDATLEDYDRRDLDFEITYEGDAGEFLKVTDPDGGEWYFVECNGPSRPSLDAGHAEIFVESRDRVTLSIDVPDPDVIGGYEEFTATFRLTDEPGDVDEQDDDQGDEKDDELLGERVLVQCHGPTADDETKRTGEVIEVNPGRLDGGETEYVVAVDGGGQAFVTRDAFSLLDDVVDRTSNDAEIVFEPDREWEQEYRIGRFGDHGPLTVRTDGELDGLVGHGKLPKLARDEYVAVDADVLEELVDCAKGKVEGDVSKRRPENVGYDLDAFVETIEQAEKVLERRR